MSKIARLLVDPFLDLTTEQEFTKFAGNVVEINLWSLAGSTVSLGITPGGNELGDFIVAADTTGVAYLASKTVKDYEGTLYVSATAETDVYIFHKYVGDNV